MAGEMAIQDGEVEARLRSPSTVAVLGIATLGLYTIVWYYKVNREMRDFGSRHGDRGLASTSPWGSVLALVIGGIVLIPRLTSLVRTVGRVQSVERIATGSARPAAGLKAGLMAAALLPLGYSSRRLGPLFVLAGLMALVVSFTLIQSRLNAALRACDAMACAPGGTALGAGATAVPDPEREARRADAQARDRTAHELFERIDRERRDRIEREHGR
jgi:hypothetical protein